MFTPILAEMIQFDIFILQMGWLKPPLVLDIQPFVTFISWAEAPWPLVMWKQIQLSFNFFKPYSCCPPKHFNKESWNHHSPFIQRPDRSHNFSCRKRLNGGSWSMVAKLTTWLLFVFLLDWKGVYRWWFQKGEVIQLDSYFWDGLKPPTICIYLFLKTMCFCWVYQEIYANLSQFYSASQDNLFCGYISSYWLHCSLNATFQSWTRIVKNTYQTQTFTI